MNSTTKLAGALFASIIALSTFATSAAALSLSPMTVNRTMLPAPSCTVITHTLYLGSRDYMTAGDVTNLQNFLRAQGRMQVGATGYFGVLTLRAVMQFQASQGISAIGLVGPLTRAAIQNVSCGTTPPPTSGLYIQSLSPNAGAVGTQVTIYGSGFNTDNTIIFGSGAIVHVASYNGTTLTFTVPSVLNPLCYYSGCMQPSQQTLPGTYSVSVQNINGATNSISFTVTSGQQVTPVSIYRISPTSGPTGTTVSITGFGFTSANIVHIGSGAIGNVPISSSIAISCTTDPSCHGGINQTLVITIPSAIGPYCATGMMCAMYMQLLTPGTYTVYIQNNNGSSNAVSFTVTGSSSSQGPTITGIDAPSSLVLGSVGTWTVHASVPSGSTTNLHYSVNWGDQYAIPNGIVASSPAATFQSSATFTHAYAQAGTYTAMFAVNDDSGRSSTVNSTITVTPLY